MDHFTFCRRLADNKDSIYYHLMHYTFDTISAAVYVLNRNNPSIPKNTRKAGQGAHFRVTRWLREDQKGAEFECYVYWTAARSFSETKGYCSDLRVDAYNGLPANAKIVFEKEGFYSKPIPKKLVQKLAGNITFTENHGKYCVPQDLLTWIPINNTVPAHEDFKPEYLATWSWDHSNHCKQLDVKIYKQGVVVEKVSKVYKSVKEFFEFIGFERKGAKYDTIQRFIKNKQNFSFNGFVFIFDEDWETVEYKIRKRKVETTEEVIDEKVVTSIEKTWEKTTGIEVKKAIEEKSYYDQLE